MKVWRILSIHQIRQTLATPNFRHLRYHPSWLTNTCSLRTFIGHKALIKGMLQLIFSDSDNAQYNQLAAVSMCKYMYV